METARLTAAEQAQLEKDARFIRIVRRVRKNGATVTVTRPLQALTIAFDKINVPGDKSDLQDAFNVAFTDGPVALVEAAVAEEPPKGA
jgi:hypothetical protein